MKALHICCAPPLLLLVLGCDEPLEPGAKVDSFRVLAERVDQPYAHPGETVQLSSLSFDPENRAVTWAWASCIRWVRRGLVGMLRTLVRIFIQSSGRRKEGRQNLAVSAK